MKGKNNSCYFFPSQNIKKYKINKNFKRNQKKKKISQRKLDFYETLKEWNIQNKLSKRNEKKIIFETLFYFFKLEDFFKKMIMIYKLQS